MSEISFGEYIRELRVAENFGQRELARNIGISAAYLNRYFPDSHQIRHNHT